MRENGNRLRIYHPLIRLCRRRAESRVSRWAPREFTNPPHEIANLVDGQRPKVDGVPYRKAEFVFYTSLSLSFSAFAMSKSLVSQFRVWHCVQRNRIESLYFEKFYCLLRVYYSARFPSFYFTHTYAHKMKFHEVYTQRRQNEIFRANATSSHFLLYSRIKFLCLKLCIFWISTHSIRYFHAQKNISCGNKSLYVVAKSLVTYGYL